MSTWRESGTEQGDRVGARLRRDAKLDRHGLKVLHVDPDELVWASEIAARTGRTRQSVEVESWFAVYEGHQPDAERSVILGAINGALQARHSLRSAHETAPLRQALEQLLVS